MLHRSPSSVVAAVVAAAAIGGCEGDDATAPKTPTAAFTFQPGDVLAPAVRRVPRSTEVRLVLVSADRRPHGVSAATPGGRTRLVVAPGERAEATLSGLEPGARYRVVPDGAIEPAVIEVG